MNIVRKGMCFFLIMTKKKTEKMQNSHFYVKKAGNEPTQTLQTAILQSRNRF